MKLLNQAGLTGLMTLATVMMLSACATVKLEGGDKPIEVNLNIKIDQEVRVRLDPEIDDLIAQNPDIF